MFEILQQTTPDTSAYMIAGFVVIFGAMAGYLISLIVRKRNLEQDVQLLEELEQKESGLSSREPKMSLSMPEERKP